MQKSSTSNDYSRGLEWLTHETRRGLFVSSGDGPRFWVFDSLRGPIALQLDSSEERPAFSYCELGPKQVAIGVWMGAVRLRIDSAPTDSAYKKAGFICAYRQRLLVKANEPRGTGQQLAITEYQNSVYYSRTVFYPSWSLLSVQNDQMRWFETPKQFDRMRSYSNYDGWSPPALTLCSS